MQWDQEKIENKLATATIGFAKKIHSKFGPGLLESAYRDAEGAEGAEGAVVLRGGYAEERRCAEKFVGGLGGTQCWFSLEFLTLR